MPYLLFRLRWCMEHKWKPWEFDQWDASDLAAWQDIMQTEQDYSGYMAELAKVRAERLN